MGQTHPSQKQIDGKMDSSPAPNIHRSQFLADNIHTFQLHRTKATEIVSIV